MSEYFTILEQGGLRRASKPLTVLILMLLAIGTVNGLVAHIKPSYQYFTTTDNRTVVVKTDGTYYLDDGTKMPPTLVAINRSPIQQFHDFMDANSSLSTLPSMIIAVVSFIASFILAIIVNPSIKTIKSVLPQWLFPHHVYIVPTRLDIASAPAGLMCMRAWTITKEGMLKSTARGVVWQSDKTKADVTPSRTNDAGIYAFQLGTQLDIFDFSPFERRVWGIVSLSGHCVGHTDNIIRATNCTIITLIVREEKYAEKLKTHYSCPILVSPKPIETIRTWVISHQGALWMQHNARLIGREKSRAIERDIESLLATKEF